MFGLAQIVAPLGVDEFLDKYWGRRAVLIPGDQSKFAELFGWTEVNNYLNAARKSYDGMRLVYDKKPLGPEQFARVDHWLSEGATLVINSANQIDPVVGSFASMLARDLNTHVNVNCYASCPSKQGFDNHFDQHDVFVVHVEGRKSWKVFEPTQTYPLHLQGTDKGDPPDTEPYIECELTPGDVLFIPRGHWHYAVAETPSIHLTVGPESRAGGEFLLWIAHQLISGEEFFRRDFPVAGAALLGGERSDTSLERHIDEFRKRLNDAIEGDQLREALIRYCMTANPIKHAHQLPRTWTLKDEITPRTRFQVPLDQKALIRYDEQEKRAVVHIRGHMLNLLGVSRAVLSALFNSGEAGLCGEELMRNDPEADWEKLRPALLHMHEHGLLELQDDMAE